jgi:hypothetical protein
MIAVLDPGFAANFMKENVAAARQAGEAGHLRAWVGFDPALDLLSDLLPRGLLQRRREASLSPIRQIDHMAGKEEREPHGSKASRG